jgi:hypothetical protein
MLRSLKSSLNKRHPRKNPKKENPPKNQPPTNPLMQVSKSRI